MIGILCLRGKNPGRYSGGIYIINNRIKVHHFGLVVKLDTMLTIKYYLHIQKIMVFIQIKIFITLVARITILMMD